MKIIEVRDGFINFEADESIYLSSFILAKGMDKSYVAQVNQKKKFGVVVIASAKILFLYNGKEFMDYDRTLPSKDCELEVFPVDAIQASIKANNPVIIGKTLDNTKNIFMDLSEFDKSTLISIDDKEMNNTIVKNLSKQFEHLGKNTIIIDTLGANKENKYIPAKDFKLPLDSSTLEFMFKSCLNDATEDSKATIAEVFNDLSEYSKTVPFVPFGVLKSIVDEMVDKQHIFKLFVLKNRLANFERLGYFASDKEEVDNLEKILSEKNSVIDLSKLNPLFQNKFLEYIYTKVDNKKTQIILELSNTVSKKNLKMIIADSEVPTTLITHSKYQYLIDIKDMFRNYIIEPSASNNEIFKAYCTFLSSMQSGMYLIAGEGINYIPVVSVVQDIDETMQQVIVQDQEDQELKQEQDEQEFDEVIEEVAAESEIEQINTDENPKETISQDELIAEIDEKSNNAIDSISENLSESADIELFSEEDDVEVEAEVPDNETSEEETETTEDICYQEEQEDIIEPEYEEVTNDAETNEISFNETEEPIEIQSSEDNIDLNENDLSDDEIGEENLELDETIDDEQEDEVVLDEVLTENDADELLENLAETDGIQSENESVELGEESLEEILTTNDEISNDDIEFSQDEDISIELSDEDEILLEQAEEIEDVSDNQMIEAEGFIEPSMIEPEAETDNLELDETNDFESEEVREDDILIDITDEDDSGIDEDVDKQIVEDVDKVFTTMKSDDELEEISDSDLDFIDELNSDGEELEEYTGELEEVSDIQPDDSILEQPSERIVPPRQPHKDDGDILEKREANTPIVPVYDADIPQEDMVVSDSIQQGDSVVHAKYGNGIVEKMIKYGTKTLFSINFENIGRRLLDPTLTEIKKL